MTLYIKKLSAETLYYKNMSIHQKVVAKFRLVAAKTSDNEGRDKDLNLQHPIIYNLELHPVYCGSPENEEFFKWTPGGKIELGTINEKAASLFLSGAKEFLVTFEAAPEASPSPANSPA